MFTILTLIPSIISGLARIINEVSRLRDTRHYGNSAPMLVEEKVKEIAA